MKELITQNYNHPSIVVWGLSNEITMKGENDPDLLENHRILNDLCHQMDSSRLTTMAVVSPCSMDCEYIQIPDTVSYNHYFGWYGGDVKDYGAWFDGFHAKYPNKAIGCSEYGCEALNWHTSEPKQGDYTEEYQAYYHEELIKCIAARPYLWATHVWNMFDFGADARNEGGENGQNHKGLVTFDRKDQKDAYYLYRALWNKKSPTLHISEKRRNIRQDSVQTIKIYSSAKDAPVLTVNKEAVKINQTAPCQYVSDPVVMHGRNVVEVKAGELSDQQIITIRNALKQR